MGKAVKSDYAGVRGMAEEKINSPIHQKRMLAWIPRFYSYWITPMREDFRLRHLFFIAFQLTAVACLFYWWPWKHLPAPDYIILAITVLVAVMSLHEGMRPGHKALWLLLIGVYAFLGVRALNKDRSEYAAKEKAANVAEQEQFQSIASGIQAAINTGQQQFNATMGEVRRAVINTEPRAFIAIHSVIPDRLIVADQSIPFNVRFENIGDDPATDIADDGRIYIAKLDDAQAQTEFFKEFNKRWKITKHAGGKKDVIVPGSGESLVTFYETFTDDQIKDVEKNGKTFYYLFRIIYSDKGGRWIQDFCGGQQAINSRVSHPCLGHNSDRYPAAKLH